MKNLLFVLAIALASCSSEDDPKPEVYVTCAELKLEVMEAQKAVDAHAKKVNQANQAAWQAELKVLQAAAISKINELTKRKC